MSGSMSTAAPTEKQCNMGPPRPGNECSTPPLLDWSGEFVDETTLIKNWSAKPLGADSWSNTSTGCMLGGFEGKRNGHFTLELNVKKDAGNLKDLHPHCRILKNPGYWCWL